MKIRSIGTTLFLFAAAVAAYAGANAEQQVAGPGKTRTITWGYWGSPSEVEENKMVAAAFEAQNPDIKIEHMTAPWGDYFTKIQTQFAAKKAPDVMFLTFISTYAPMGVLMEMEPLFAKYGFDKSQYSAGALGLFTVNGKLYGVPRDNDTKVLFVNKALFAQAGIPLPKGSWTTDQFVEAAKKLTLKKANGESQYGLMFDPQAWYLWVFMNEGSMFDDEGKPTKVKFDAASIEALQWAGDLIHKHKVTPAFDQLNNGTIRQQYFMNGQAAMIIDNHSQVPSLLGAKGLDWEVVPLPTFPGKKHHNVAGGAGYCISNETKNVDAAWRFWKFLNTEGVKLYMKSGTMVPAGLSLLKSTEFSGNKSYNAQVFIDETMAGREFPNNPSWWDVYSKAVPFFEKIWAVGESAASAYAAAESELQKLIK